jgi:cytochrome c oxidase subunit 2
MSIRTKGGILGSAIFTMTGDAFADWTLNLPEPVSPVTREIFNLHMLTATVALVIMVIVTAVIIYSLWKFRKSAGYEADQNFHTGWFGKWSWVLVPVVVLGIDLSIAGKASKVFSLVEDTTPPELTLKVTGSQWKWSYDYMEDDIQIVSNLDRDIAESEDTYLRDVDNKVILPVDTRIRFLHTATDVLHAWWVPALAYKKDAIPGYINETWAIIEKEGIYRGQCAEICGTGHAFMPIVIEAVSKEKYAAWVTGKKEAATAALAEASADKTWSMDELMARGEQVYNTSCGACHQPTGLGLPPAFPALKGSAFTTTGEISAHLDIIINGKPGTAMAAWGAQLNDLEIAAVTTYERNAWGNDTGDMVQPADVKAARSNNK